MDKASLEMTATEAAGAIARGELTAEAYASACLDRVAELEPRVEAFVHLDREHVLAQARALDERRQRRGNRDDADRHRGNQTHRPGHS
jgi:Asp-tRNA(Asn)/Glu-tRNA(Gln) amidotransferase A subunit family amidase